MLLKDFNLKGYLTELVNDKVLDEEREVIFSTIFNNTRNAINDTSAMIFTQKQNLEMLSNFHISHSYCCGCSNYYSYDNILAIFKGCKVVKIDDYFNYLKEQNREICIENIYLNYDYFFNLIDIESNYILKLSNSRMKNTFYTESYLVDGFFSYDNEPIIFFIQNIKQEGGTVFNSYKIEIFQ